MSWGGHINSHVIHFIAILALWWQTEAECVISLRCDTFLFSNSLTLTLTCLGIKGSVPWEEFMASGRTLEKMDLMEVSLVNKGRLQRKLLTWPPSLLFCCWQWGEQFEMPWIFFIIWCLIRPQTASLPTLDYH